MRRLGTWLVAALVAGGCGGTADPAPTWDDAPVVAIATTSDGRVWLGAADGSLMWTAGDRRHRVDLPNLDGPIWAIAPEGTGVVVAAGSATAHHDGTTWSKVVSVCAGCVITAFGADGGLRGGMERTTGRGFVIDGDAPTVLHDVVPVIPSASAITEIVEGPAAAWIATAAAGVAWTDGSSWRLHALQTGSLRDDRVFDIAGDDRGGLWVATQTGVTYLTAQGHSHVPAGVLPDSRARSLAVTREAVWVGTHGGGIARLDLVTGRWAVILPAHRVAAVTRLAADGAGVWAGTEGDGLVYVDRHGAATRFTVADGLTDGRITALQVMPDTTVWAGMPGGVALRITPDGIESVEVVSRIGSERRDDAAATLDADRITIPAGEFLMGSDQQRADEAPQRLVALGDFQIHRHEVTNAQYARFVAAAGVPRPAAWPLGRVPPGEALHPVAGVRPEEAAAYCEWLGMRLPTEAEWERAARGTNGRTWPWGDVWDPAMANTLDAGIGWSTPVGTYPQGASPDGALDMAGNLTEWVADFYDPEYYADAPDVDPQGPSTVTNRVRRGGSWAADADEARTTRRASSHGSSPDLRAGFRCAAG